MCEPSNVSSKFNAYGSLPSEGVARSLVALDTLPTLVANCADAYVLVQTHRPPRFLSVQEICRAFGVPDGPMLRTLLRPDGITASQATACLGRGVHCGVARQLIVAMSMLGIISPTGLGSSGTPLNLWLARAPRADAYVVFAGGHVLGAPNDLRTQKSVNDARQSAQMRINNKQT